MGKSAKQQPHHQRFKRHLAQQLQQHHDRLEHFLAVQHFTHQALFALCEPTQFENTDQWQFGYFLHQRSLQQQGEALSHGLSAIQQAVNR